ncbi:hypothetical protein NC653_000225 [Populus alba x Populus x berolinensis]|uniref:Uncharacterized protein n=1 Tax=Populus alba x Populus x berolinensis TaxID=444605 RepID=A0AAD6WE44_9ROSI|nr:hypothetical protein NC653_000225 [Populus alba x Populus x berolinensis]
MMLMVDGGNGGVAQVHVDYVVQASEQLHLSLVPITPSSSISMTTTLFASSAYQYVLMSVPKVITTTRVGFTLPFCLLSVIENLLPGLISGKQMKRAVTCFSF